MTKKLIYVEDAIEEIIKRFGIRDESYLTAQEKAVVQVLKTMPPAQPMRMKAKWERKGKPNSGKNVEWVCTHCGYSIWAEFCNVKYCSSCGFYMRDDDMEADE